MLRGGDNWAQTGMEIVQKDYSKGVGVAGWCKAQGERQQSRR